MLSVLGVKTFASSISSWLGRVEVAATEDSLLFVGVGSGRAAKFLRALGLHPPSEGGSELIGEAVAQLIEYFEGRRRSFSLPVNFLGTDFQVRVWEKTMEIPYGSTRSYSWVARRVGCASPRPVGRALSANHLMLIVPCHRVVEAHGGLGGFSAGLALKKKLLQHEARHTGRAAIKLNPPRCAEG
ncbi:Methylated-DNA--protein-cysteine methyltransferase, inducible [Candidatus Calditenuaceae archaeon HR02]|nr:Methylated-DNA--protein-cysteine methyltransferase, inducible [Candidatus Calditenuaceae archaeon HR02]